MSLKKDRLSVDNLNKYNNILSPIKKKGLNKSFQLKKLKYLQQLNDTKITEIKGRTNHSSFHLVGESDRFNKWRKRSRKKYWI